MTAPDPEREGGELYLACHARAGELLDRVDTAALHLDPGGWALLDLGIAAGTVATLVELQQQGVIPTGSPVPYGLVRWPAGDTPTVVAFRIAHPADPVEGAMRLLLHRASWDSQGAPGELTVSMTAPA